MITHGGPPATAEDRVLIKILAARWLGHGRATECFFALVSLVYGIELLLIPGAVWDSSATAYIAWLGFGHWLSIPPLIHAWLSGSGLIANILGHPASRILRFSGAIFGSVLWGFYAAMFAVIGKPVTVGFPFAIVSIIFMMRIGGLALANLPRPGAPGAVGK